MPPIYEYQCDGICGAKFSILTTYEHRNDKQTCPGCYGTENHPVLSATRTTFTFADKCAEKRVRAPKQKRATT